MTKVIMINSEQYRVVDTESGACIHCAFRSIECPIDSDYNVLCDHFHGVDTYAYFVKLKPEEIPATKSLVQDFTTEKTYTEAQIKAAYCEWNGDTDSEADRFVSFLQKHSDPEYAEFMRMKQKFGE